MAFYEGNNMIKVVFYKLTFKRDERQDYLRNYYKHPEAKRMETTGQSSDMVKGINQIWQLTGYGR